MANVIRHTDFSNQIYNHYIPTNAKDARTVFDALQEVSMTTFHLPFREFTLQPTGITMHDVEEMIERAPFSNFTIESPGRIHLYTIVEHYRLRGEKPSKLQLDLIRSDGYMYTRVYDTIQIKFTGLNERMVVVISKIVHDDGLVVWLPDSGTRQSFVTSCEAWFRLYTFFRDRKHRFLGKPVSRQVRRATGKPADYREYIIVDREHKEYEQAETAKALFKRMKALHAVRGHSREEHLRQYKDGRIVVVAGSNVTPHTRGKGELLQAKEYRLK